MCIDAEVPLAAETKLGCSDCDHQHMDATDTLWGGQRHELGGEPGDDRGLAAEVDAVPDRDADAVPSGVGMRPRRPGGRECRLETRPEGGEQR